MFRLDVMGLYSKSGSKITIFFTCKNKTWNFAVAQGLDCGITASGTAVGTEWIQKHFLKTLKYWLLSFHANYYP